MCPIAELHTIWRVFMKIPMCAFAAIALSFSSTLMLGVPAHAKSPAYCQSVAHDYARRNASGGAISGAVRGSVRGGVTGLILGGKDGAEKGRDIGRTLGGISGASQRARSYDYLYQQAYANCIRY